MSQLFFDCWVHGATVCCAVVSLIEDGSVRREGPTNIFALSSFICPSVEDELTEFIVASAQTEGG